MVLTLEITGESVADSGPLGALTLDEKNMLTMDYEALRKIIVQLVGAINTMNQHASKLKENDDQLFDAVQNLEQQLATFEMRSRECEDACQQVTLQLGTMIIQQEQAPEVTENSAGSDVSRKDITDLSLKVESIFEDLEKMNKTHREHAALVQAQCNEFEDALHRHQEYFDDDLERRLSEADDERVTFKADLDTLRTVLEDSNARKATKVELADLGHRVHVLADGQAANNHMLKEAQVQFSNLESLTDLVNENKRRMQEMWALFGKESQELREWAASGFSELRSVVRIKMNEQEALAHVEEIRKEVRELAPFMSEAMSRLAVDVRHKADFTTVTKLEDCLEELQKKAGRPKQLLVGTKCLACDRRVNGLDATDQTLVNLNERRQEAELWKEVQKALSSSSSPKMDISRPLGSKDVLKYVAVHVGSPNKASAYDGHMYEGRDLSDTAPGSHYLVRAGGGGGGFSRPQTSNGQMGRSPPREAPPLVRVSPRKQVPPPRVPVTSREGQPRHRMTATYSLRTALGQCPPPPATAPATTSEEASYARVVQEDTTRVGTPPTAQSRISQPQVTNYFGDHDDSRLEGGSSSEFGSDSQSLSREDAN